MVQLRHPVESHVGHVRLGVTTQQGTAEVVQVAFARVGLGCDRFGTGGAREKKIVGTELHADWNNFMYCLTIVTWKITRPTGSNLVALLNMEFYAYHRHVVLTGLVHKFCVDSLRIECFIM